MHKRSLLKYVINFEFSQSPSFPMIEIGLFELASAIYLSRNPMPDKHNKDPISLQSTSPFDIFWRYCYRVSKGCFRFPLSGHAFQNYIALVIGFCMKATIIEE